MTKNQLSTAVSVMVQTTHDALQMIVDELNHGQRKKIVKNPEVKELLDRYHVDYE